MDGGDERDGEEPEEEGRGGGGGGGEAHHGLDKPAGAATTRGGAGSFPDIHGRRKIQPGANRQSGCYLLGRLPSQQHSSGRANNSPA